jgi:predicted HTH transcriptional regulator
VENQILEKLIENGETQSLEFKESLRKQKEALNDLCGMINTEKSTGMVVFGVKPDNTICGVEPGDLDSAQQTLTRSIREKFEPVLSHSIKLLTLQGKQLVIIEASRSQEVPYFEYDGRAFIREGSVTRHLSLEEKKQYAKMRNRDNHGGPWKCSRCGSRTMVFFGTIDNGNEIKRSYECECGGEYWPV